MKKILLSCLAIAMSASMFAVNYTGKVTIALYDGSYLPNLIVGESSDAEFAGGALVNGYYAPVQDLAGAPLSIYVDLNGVAYENIVLDDLTNIPVGIKTSSATSYTLYFAGLQGTMSLYDKKLGQTIDCSANYNFTIDATEVNSTINDRFVLKYVPAAPSICFNYNKLEVKGHAGESIVVKQGATEIINEAVADDDETYDLSAYTGRLVVTLGTEVYQIDANPAVTVVP